MTKKTRYALILFGFIFFMVISPVIVLYVRGITYDFNTGQFVKTGILGVRTDPQSVNIFLDGKLARKSSGDIKFLKPGSYLVSLKKDGYREWSKRLFVDQGEVAWANPINNYVYLLLNAGQIQTISSEVNDFYADQSTLAYLAKNSLVISPANHPAQTENYVLPKPVDSITASPNGKLFELSQKNPGPGAAGPNELFFNLDGRAFTDLNALFSATSSPPKFVFSPNNELYALQNGSLYKLDVTAGRKTAIATNVKALGFQNNNLYYVRQTTGELDLVYGSLPPQGEPQVLLANLPQFQNGEIIVSFERQAFLLLDQSLYKVSNSLQKLADNVTSWSFNRDDSTLTFFHGSELSYYNPFTNALNFISRSSEPLGQLNTRVNLDYTFYLRDNSAMALELDTRDHQNEYALYSGTNIVKFLANKNGTQGYILDGGALKQIQIR